MTQSTRKLIGTVLTLALVVVWAIASTAIYMQFLGNAHPMILLGYFIVAGLLWGVPVAWIIRWMAKPDRA
jgi:hypothetical protein